MYRIVKMVEKLYACYIDMKKAFDTVWHDALFLKLQKADISGKILISLSLMYSNSRSRVKCKHVLSHSITGCSSRECIEPTSI